MPCLACFISALDSFLASTPAAGRIGLRARNVRYSTVQPSTRLLPVNSFTPRNQPASTSRISKLQLSQVPGINAALSSVEDPRLRTQLSNRDKTGSTRGVEYRTTIPGTLGGAAGIMTTPVALSSRRDSMKLEGFPKSHASSKNGASTDQHILKANMQGIGRGGDVTSLRLESSVREENPGSFKIAGLGTRAPLRVYSSRTIEGSKGAMPSSRSTRASADLATGNRSYKDQREPWQKQKKALSEKFGPTGWLPRKRLSPDTLEGIRALHAQYPDKFTTPILADQFKVSPEAIRRILKSKWRPKDVEAERRRRRWEKRGETIWSQMVEMGIKPPKKWRDMGVGKSRKRKPARSKQLESQVNAPYTPNAPSESTTDILRTVTANEHEIGSSVPLADRIL